MKDYKLYEVYVDFGLIHKFIFLGLMIYTITSYIYNKYKHLLYDLSEYEGMKQI